MLRGLERIAQRRLIADFIFLDPPYENEPELLEVLDYLDVSHLVAPRGLVIVEHRKRTELPERLERLERTGWSNRAMQRLVFIAWQPPRNQAHHIVRV